MNRIIKYRFWIEKERKMAEWEMVLKECNRLSLLEFEGFVPLQFSGLFDKNGKEVYEGDKVSFYYISTYEQRSFSEYVDLSETKAKRGEGVVYWNASELQWFVKPTGDYETYSGNGPTAKLDEAPLCWVGLSEETLEDLNKVEETHGTEILGFEVIGNIHQHSNPL